MVPYDENKPADHECVQNFIDIVAWVIVSIFSFSIGLQSFKCEGSPQIRNRLD